MDAVGRILAKRDLRTYVDRPISPAVLAQILEAGRRSGSARNRQPWEFVVVTDPAVRRALAQCGRVAAHLARAPVVIVIVVADTHALFDAGRCAQSMMLVAWLLGVASCPVTLHDERRARAALMLPEGPALATAVALGYPDPQGRGRLERLALRVLAGRGRKPLADLVSWNRYGNRA
jgi:nitroreductase